MIIDAITLIIMNLATSNAITIPHSTRASFHRKHRWIHNFHWLHSRSDISWSNLLFSKTHATKEIWSLAERILKSLNFQATIIEVWVTFWPDFNWKILDHFSNHWCCWPGTSRPSLQILINLKTMDPRWRLQYSAFLWIRTRSQNLMLPQEEIWGN